jgi:HAE1 family hydrophobic/amphiphilic exporter-1
VRSFLAGTVVRPVTTAMVTLALLVFGFVAFTRLPVELLPDLAYPTLTIQTEDGNAAPAEVEELITRPIEERVGAVVGVVRVESSSREGMSEVTLDFAWGTEVDRAIADVREKLDRVTLPATAARPIVLRYDPSADPIMRIALRGPDARLRPEELATLRQQADRVVKRRLEKIPGVAAARIHGGHEEEVVVELDAARIAALGLTTADIGEAIRRSNINQPGGALTEKHNRWLIRTLHEARTVEQLSETIVRSESGAELRLSEVAKVYRGPREAEELATVDGYDAIELALYREGDANVVAVAHALAEGIARLPLPAGHSVVVLDNQAEFIEQAVDEVRDNALIGGALAVLVLLFFLRDLRSTLVIALAIPISLLATFVPLASLDVSLNVMSLGGLALGVGMLVDNSIVVLESIARVREKADADPDPDHRMSRRQIAIEGATEVGSSVVASTLTTVAVFFPMAFVEGVAGQLVRDLAYAVSFSILSSMLVSLTVVPVLQSLGDPVDEADAPPSRSWLAWIFAIPALAAWPVVLVVRLASTVLRVVATPVTASWDWLERRYPAVLRGALRVRSLVLLAAVGICVMSVQLFADGGQTLLPDVEQHRFFIQLRLGQGASLSRTADTVRALERAVQSDPDIRTRFARIGSVTRAGSAGGNVTGPHLAQLDIHLDPTANQAEAEARIFAAIVAANPEPEASLRLDRPALLSFDPPIEVQVFAEDHDALVAEIERILPDLRTVPRLTDVAPDELVGRPEVRIRFDRERLGRVGLAVDDAAAAISRAIEGEVVSTLYAPDDQLDVRVQLPRVDRSSVADVGRIQVGVVDNVPIRLASVAEVQPGLGPAQIRRIDGRRGLRIQARVEGVDLGGVATDVEAVLDAHADDDPRVEALLAGQADEMQTSLRSLAFTAALSVFLVYVVMASSFESLLHPFLIMFTVPLALAGVAIAVFIAKLPLSAMVAIGFIVLGGIVVNNAIVLINAVNDRRGAGLDVKTALLEAGALRLRPILMTTLTTVLGLMPMALGYGEGAALRQPLAVAVIGGLTLSTLLTLVVIPCAYSLLPGRTEEAWRRR